MRKILFSIGLIIAAFSFLASPSRASEGTAELTSTKGQVMRCDAYSMLMENYEYQISLNCRDLIYPPKPDAFSYILWATPTQNDKPLNIGELGVGKGNFKTKTAFSKLFVTIESDVRTKAPEGEIVMEGTIQGIPFLDKAGEVSQPESEKVTPSPTSTPARTTSSARNILGKILGTGAIILGLVLVVVIVVYFLSRRRIR